MPRWKVPEEFKRTGLVNTGVAHVLNSSGTPAHPSKPLTKVECVREAWREVRGRERGGCETLHSERSVTPFDPKARWARGR
jgi:hypothetical protein